MQLHTFFTSFTIILLLFYYICVISALLPQARCAAPDGPTLAHMPTNVDPKSFVRLPTRNPCFRRKENGLEFCLPHTYIVGLPKAGTSALWYKLSSHPDIDTMPGTKENCPRDTWPSLENVLEWASGMAAPGDLANTSSSSSSSSNNNSSKSSSSGGGGGGGGGGGSSSSGGWSSADGSSSGGEGGRVILNGCIGYGGIRGHRYFKLLQDFFGVTDFKVLLMLRNYPDWLYAGWNYWCWPELGDEACEAPNFFIKKGLHSRSPRLWHDLITDPEQANKYAYYGDNYLYGEIFDRLHAVVGDNVMVVAQEELQSTPLRTLRSIEAFLGLPAANYSQQVLNGVVNHHSAVGWDTVLSADDDDVSNRVGGGSGDGAQTSAAAAGGGGSGSGSSSDSSRNGSSDRDMLAESRALLDARWMADCLYLWERIGMCFATCCQNGSTTEAALAAAAVGSGNGTRWQSLAAYRRRMRRSGVRLRLQ